MRHAIEVQGLTKLHRRADGAWRAALSEVSFVLPAGASLGLCGANGAGKSTLLRILAGATPQTSGRWRAAGPLRSVVELGAGFHPDLSGRENALQLAALDGLRGRAARHHAQGALEFAELVESADEPLYAWSSGMQLRLAFACALAHDARVLLLDEVFAVGDAGFQGRCVERLRALQKDGASIVLCSHSLYDLRQLCDRGLWLDGGRVRHDGACAEATARYAAETRTRGLAPERTAPAPEGPRIESVELLPGHEVASGSELRVRIAWSSPTTAEVHCGVGLLDTSMEIVAACGTHLSGREPERGRAGTFELRLPSLALLSGSLRVAAWLFDRHGLQRHDETVHERPLTVYSRGGEVGRVMLEHQWSHVEPVLRAPLPGARDLDATHGPATTRSALEA